MDEEPGIIENEVFRENLWDLAEVIISNPNEWPSHARKRVGWLLRDGLGDGELYEFFLEDEDTIRELIFILLDDPDPDIERDRPPEDYAGYNDPSHTALNTVRPVALDALIIYSFREWGGDNAGLNSEIAEEMERMLDDISLGVHSVFGREFVQLWATDETWVREHLPEIFPRSQSRRDIKKFTAAWDSYVAFNKVYSDIFPEIREYYFHAIDLMTEGEHTEIINAEQRMAGHLLFNYLYEYDLEEWSDSLLAYLYDRSDPELARHVAWHLWNHGGEIEEDDVYDKWKKTCFLWRERLEQVGDDIAYSDEISWFVEWLEHVEDRVPLDEVCELLRDSDIHIIDSRRAWEATEVYLAHQSNQFPDLAVELFYDLIQEFERLPRRGFSDEVAAVLQPAFHGYDRDTEVYQKAFEIAQRYASEGHDEAQRFIDSNI
jgi:hypothetical protein